MNELIYQLVEPLVDFPSDIRVEATSRNGETVYKLSLHPDDVGKVIGKHGKVAKAIRTLVHAAATHKRERVHLEID